MGTVRTGTDRWTYYEFGTRSFYDQICAAITRETDDGVYHNTVLANLGQQPSAGTFPFVSVFPERIPLESKPIDPQGVCRVTKIVLPVKLDQQNIAVADTHEADETTAKLIDCLSRRVTLDLSFALLFGRSIDSGIPTLAEMRQAVNVSREYL